METKITVSDLVDVYAQELERVQPIDITHDEMKALLRNLNESHESQHNHSPGYNSVLHYRFDRIPHYDTFFAGVKLGFVELPPFGGLEDNFTGAYEGAIMHKITKALGVKERDLTDFTIDDRHGHNGFQVEELEKMQHMVPKFAIPGHIAYLDHFVIDRNSCPCYNDTEIVATMNADSKPQQIMLSEDNPVPEIDIIVLRELANKKDWQLIKRVWR